MAHDRRRPAFCIVGIGLRRHDGCVHVAVRGELDGCSTPGLLRILEVFAAEGVAVRLDLAGVDFAGSAALPVLRGAPGDVVVVGVSRSVERLLDVADRCGAGP